MWVWIGGVGGRLIGSPGGEEGEEDEEGEEEEEGEEAEGEERRAGASESLATLVLTTSPLVGMLLRGREVGVVSAADADLTMSLGGEYFVEIGSEDLPTSARREGDFSLGGRTTAGRSLGGEPRGRRGSGGNGLGFSWGGGGLGRSLGDDILDLSRYCGGVFDLSLGVV